ncbi:hypothetical protein HD806DRAFT_504056 [Xylariaceae sp. AK1471]|nr:hypothetical protein HD806DRAFT_504056 [Xylariaceae sp. AK1471]
MFGTIRYNNVTQGHEHVQLTGPSGVEARGYTMRACDPCRSRKLKCSGEKDGCERCKTTLLTCTYAGNMGSEDGLKQRSTSWPWPPSNRPPKRRKSLQSSSAEKASDKEALQEEGTSLAMPSKESTVDIGEAQGTVWSDFSSNLVEDEDLEFMQSFPTGDGADSAGVFDREVLNMVISPTHARWSQSSSAGTQQDDVAHMPPRQLTPVSLGPVWAASTPSSDGRRYSAGCQCLHTMAQLLEDTGTLGSDKGVDTLLMCIGCGIKAYGEALSCAKCNICAENGMLIAMVAQRLSAAATSVASKLCPAGNVNSSSNNNHNRLNSGAPGEVFDGPIVFGGYRIEISTVRSSLVYNMTHQHLADLRTLLSRIKNRMGLKWGAVEMIADAEDMVVKSRARIQQLLESSRT